MSNKPLLRVLILGASGVFGSRLARLVADEPGLVLTCAGRRLAPLAALVAKLGTGSALQLDRDQVTPADVASFDLAVDCAGPFQRSHSRVIEACIAAQVDYIDLADGREFVGAIRRFDTVAREAGIAVLSGASSIPALSHAVLDAMVANWRRVDTIKVGIFPGNQAPRGRSVVEAILSYVGKPVRVFAGGRWVNEPGWALKGRVDCGEAGRRWASVCDTPEQDLLVERYSPTRSAEFVAGLELPVLHLGLWLLSFPVRWGWIGSLRPAAGLLLWIARRLQPFGSDRGAMIVSASGTGVSGQPVAAEWRLEANAGRGPDVPVLAAVALLRRARDYGLPKGAQPCAGILAMAEFEPLLDAAGLRREWRGAGREPKGLAVQAAVAASPLA